MFSGLDAWKSAASPHCPSAGVSFRLSCWQTDVANDLGDPNALQGVGDPPLQNAAQTPNGARLKSETFLVELGDELSSFELPDGSWVVEM